MSIEARDETNASEPVKARGAGLKTKEHEMLKELFDRFVAWVKGFPWLLGVASMVVATAVLTILVHGKLYWWDWVVLNAIFLAITFMAWKLSKRAK